MNNVLTINLSNDHVIIAKDCLWQYDYGQKIVFTGVELPETFEVHFGNNQDVGTAKQTLGSDNQVTIPDEFLTSGKNLYAWIFLHTGENDGETEYRITVPIKERPAPDPTEPTPVEQDIITQAIAALNEGITRTEQSAEDAEAWSVGQRNGVDVPSDDPTYHNNAKYYAETASASATSADESASDASGYASAASDSAESAGQSASNAEGYAESASGSASDAATSEGNALGYAERAESAKNDAESAKNDAETAESHAEGYSSSAAESATSAESNAIKSEGFAIGEQDGTPVESGSPYYQNNAAYYAEQARQLVGTLPNPSNADNGKVAEVINGAWAKGTNIRPIKKTTDEVDDKLLRNIWDSPNIYDVDNNSIYVTIDDEPTSDTTSEWQRGTVYLYGYSGDVVVSTAGNQASYFRNLHVYDALGNEIPNVAFGEIVNSSTGSIRQGYVVTIPANASYFTFTYRTHSPDKLLVRFPMVTLGGTIENGDFVPYAAHHAVTEMVDEELFTRPVYVSTTGSDDNDGWSIETAVATFEKALRLSNVIYAERGVYAENVTVKDKENVVIAPYDNDDWVPSTDPGYVAGTPRQMIEFNGGEVLTPSPGRYLFVGNYEGGLMFERLFSQDPNNPGPDFLDLVANESKKQYRCNVFVNLFNGGKLKLKPVWTQEDLTDDTFTWDPETRLLAMNVTSADWGQDFHTVTILKQTTNLRVQNCKNVRISDLAVKYNYSTCIGVENSDDVTFTNCEASFSATGMGFGFKSTNGRLEHCFAQGNGVDGFNFHEYGYSEMTDCDSFWNWDDGCSHHQGCAGTINGGTFKGNGKAGIAPAYGATVNILGAVCIENESYGIGYLYDQTQVLPAKGVVIGGAVANNPIGLKVEDYCTVTTVGLIYNGNTENRSVVGTLNEFGDNKAPFPVRLLWDAGENKYYADHTMGEIFAAITAERNVTVSYEIPSYGITFTSPLAVYTEINAGGGTMMYFYGVQAVDSNSGTLMAVTAQGFAADTEWTLNAYSL